MKAEHISHITQDTREGKLGCVLFTTLDRAACYHHAKALHTSLARQSVGRPFMTSDLHHRCDDH